MKWVGRWAPFLLPWVLSCSEPPAGAYDTSDYSTWDCSSCPCTEISSVEYEYTDEEWFYQVKTDYWSSQALLDIAQTGATDGVVSEQHLLWQGEYDMLGSWDSWEITLPIVPREQQVNGETTAFPGNAETEATLTFMFTTYDIYLGTPECWVMGHDPSWFDGFACSVH